MSLLGSVLIGGILKFVRCKCKSTSKNVCRTNLCSCQEHGLNKDINWFVDTKLWQTTSILSTRHLIFVTNNFLFQNNSKSKKYFYVQDGCLYGCLVLKQSYFFKDTQNTTAQQKL